MARLDGRRVLVTGASSGIGRATAEAIVAEGGRVALLARTPEQLHDVAGPLGDAAVVQPADVTDPGAVAAAVGRVGELLGGLDAVVNAAGVVRLGGIDVSGPDDWKATFDVNVLGLLNVTQAALPLLRASTSADIVNISSMSGRRRLSIEMTVYSASKFAVHVISDGLREELAPDGIRVSIISPSFVRTPIFDDTPDDELRHKYQEALATKGLDPEAVAAQVVHALAQPDGVDVFEIALLSTDR
ncbi:MAG: SDR family oxidoreductase [Ilumatobacteraceae bacterium]